VPVILGALGRDDLSDSVRLCVKSVLVVSLSVFLIYVVDFLCMY
jgi:hypothetical protein